MKRRRASFQVFERLDRASTGQRGTLTIDRESGLCEVRPYRRRVVYALPLSYVAHLICRHMIWRKLADDRAAKVKAKPRRRQGNA